MTPEEFLRLDPEEIDRRIVEIVRLAPIRLHDLILMFVPDAQKGERSVWLAVVNLARFRVDVLISRGKVAVADSVLKLREAIHG